MEAAAGWAAGSAVADGAEAVEADWAAAEPEAEEAACPAAADSVEGSAAAPAATADWAETAEEVAGTETRAEETRRRTAYRVRSCAPIQNCHAGGRQGPKWSVCARRARRESCETHGGEGGGAFGNGLGGGGGGEGGPGGGPGGSGGGLPQRRT